MNNKNGTGLLVPEEISLIVSSDPNNGAINASSDGSYFEIELQDGLGIPKNALNTQVSVEDATIWWVVPNILSGVNDTFEIKGPNTLDVTTDYTVVVPQGLYDLTGLSQAILRDLENQGAKTSPSAIVSFTADEATQKVEITMNYAVCEIDFTVANSFRDILGFNSQVLGPLDAGVQTLGDNVAAFNTVNYFLIHSDLTQRGIRFNNDFNQTLAQVPIDVSPGSQIVYKPINPAKVNASELAGAKRNLLRFWLTDDSQTRVNTNGEYWSARIVVRYLRPHVLG